MTVVKPESIIILLVIPQNRFCDMQLAELKSCFDEVFLKTIILSRSGNEAVGEENTRVIPDGILVDWDKKFLQKKNYDAVIVVGGKGAKNSIWNDPILPQILTDHFRAGKIVGALGLSVVSLARSGLLARRDASAPNHDTCIRELEEAGAFVVEDPLTSTDNIVTAGNNSSGKLFGKEILRLLGVT
jgi:putative intracellular protease/amidase